MKAINMINIYRKYKGQWVAIEDPKAIKPRVVASGKTLDEVLDEAKRKGFETPVVTQIPKKVLPIVGPFITR